MKNINALSYRISIIIPNYNGGKFIEGCLKSILSQSYENYEIVIVDGKSTDTSHEIIEKYMTISEKIHWLKVDDMGISHAFNLGIKAAKGDFVLLLGSDDYLYPEILMKFGQFTTTISEFQSADIHNSNFYCDSINYWSFEKKFIKRVPQTDVFTRSNLVRYGNISGFQNIYLNKKWFETYEINQKNKYSMDYECYFEMLQAGQDFIHLPEINSINCLGENTTCKYWYESQKEANTISYKNGVSIVDYVFVFKRFLMREFLRILKVSKLVD